MKTQGPPLKVSLDEFLRDREPAGKKSILEPFSEHIDEALRRRMSYGQIVAWLSENDVNVTTQTLNKWVLRRRARVAKQGHVATPGNAANAGGPSARTANNVALPVRPALPTLDEQPGRPLIVFKSAVKPTGRAVGLSVEPSSRPLTNEEEGAS